MRFIILFVALVLYSYGRMGNWFKPFQWFPDYYETLGQFFSKYRLWQGYVGVACSILPIFLVVLIVYGLLHHLLYYFVGFVLSLIIVLYCIDPQRRVRMPGASVKVSETVVNGAEAITVDQSAASVSVQSMVMDSFRGYFAVLFWYILLGPLGALAYRLLQLTEQSARQNGESMMLQASHILNVIEWPAARLMSLGFALMGHFTVAFEFWLHHCLGDIETNQNLLEGTASRSLDLPEKAEFPVQEQQHLFLNLVMRTFILFLAVLGLIILGRFV